MATPSSAAKKKKKKNKRKSLAGGDAADSSPMASPAPSPGGSPRWAVPGRVDASIADPEDKSGKGADPQGPRARSWKDGIIVMNPRTMEAAGFALSQPVLLLAPRLVRTSEIGEADTGPRCPGTPAASAGGDGGGEDNDTFFTPMSSAPTVRHEPVVCLEVWPSTSMHPRKIKVPGRPRPGLGVGDAVRVAGVPIRAISAITISVAQGLSLESQPFLARHLKAELQGRHVYRGQKVAGSFRGSPIEMVVTDIRWATGPGSPARGLVRPSDADAEYPAIGRVRDGVEIQLAVGGGGGSEASADPASGPGSATTRETTRMTQETQGSVTYDAVGGLGPQLEIIRDTIELPLRRPELFHRFHIRPPGGILLVGPPGTGKTLIAKACANASQCYTQFVNGPEVISKFYGETERTLRELFHRAQQNAPAIIFIDEIDALCPSREKAPNELEKRIVAAMLTLMDGLNTAATSTGHIGHVLVIGATNRPQSLDAAIRRPGRFDREIEIGVPNATGREDILKAILRNTPNTASEDDLATIAAVAHGYVGADLSAVCNEAALIAAQRVIRSAGVRVGGDIADGNDEASLAAEVVVDLADLWDGLKRVRPSAMREVYVDVPKVRWTDIGGQEDTKQQLKEAVEWPLKHPEAFTRMGIRPPRGVLLYGPPGCSKTLMAKALATETSLNFLAVKGPELFSKWVGESEKAVQTVFKKARAAAPAIIFFDEIDALAAQREEGGQSRGVGERVLSQLLSEMDGVEELANVTVVAATNRPDMIDAALLRPGRMDRKIYVGPPDVAARQQIFEGNLARMPHADGIDVAGLARSTDGHSGAEVVAICREAALNAMKEDPSGASMVTAAHFAVAMENVPRNITPEMLEFYARYQEGKPTAA